MRPRGLIWFVLLMVACGRSPPKSEGSAPSASASPGKADACARGGGTLDDASRASFFPRTIGGFCIDPHADSRSYGRGAKAPLGAVCEALEGECARYARFGLERVLVVPYVSGENPRARLSVTLLELASPEASFSLFTDRILGDSPDDVAAWRALDDDGTKVRSGAKALAWRAKHLALLEYGDDTTTPGRAAEHGAGPLEALARELVARLPGKPELPRSVALLPKRDDGPRAVRFEHEDLFGIGGLGAGAVARYAPAGRNAPLALLARLDDDSAKDVLRTLRRIPGARSLRGAPYEAVSVTIQERDAAPRLDWIFGRKRNVVLGVGREREKLDRAGRDRVRHAEVMRLKTLLDELR